MQFYFFGSHSWILQRKKILGKRTLSPNLPAAFSFRKFLADLFPTQHNIFILPKRQTLS